VIAWNPSVDGATANPFGTTTALDILGETYTYTGMTVNGESVQGGLTHRELQTVAGAWGSPWYKDPSAGNGYPILEWQFKRGDYLELCGFEFDNNQTGIESVVTSKQNAQNDVYDLSGRKVAGGKLSGGIYIINGKKKVVR
jgi:hypothetical protein